MQFKSLVFIIFLFLGASLSASDRICSEYLNLKHNTQIRGYYEQGIRPYLGLIVQTEPSGLLLLIGPYFNNSHQNMLNQLLAENKYVISGFLWAGELLVSTSSRAITLHGGNESSVFYENLIHGKSEFRNNSNPWSIGTSLSHSFVAPNNINYLDFFRQKKAVQFSSIYNEYLNELRLQKSSVLVSYSGIPSFSSENGPPFSLWSSDEFPNSQNLEEFTNNIFTVFSWLYAFNQLKTKKNISLEFIKPKLSLLNVYVKTYMKWNQKKPQVRPDSSQKSSQQRSKLDPESEKLNQFLNMYEIFNSTEDPFLVFSEDDWLKFEVMSRFAFEVVFRETTNPIRFSFFVLNKD